MDKHLRRSPDKISIDSMLVPPPINYNNKNNNATIQQIWTVQYLTGKY